MKKMMVIVTLVAVVGLGMIGLEMYAKEETKIHREWNIVENGPAPNHVYGEVYRTGFCEYSYISEEKGSWKALITRRVTGKTYIQLLDF